ncbi:Ribonuclease HII [Marinibacterium anthonyi]|nr:Ribonuclease HII [Marinibacterium anthonyi]
MWPMTQPDYSYETRLAAAGALRVAGTDEVGRGPLAGPVVAAAVVLDPLAIPAGMNDSKTLSKKRRARLAAQILEVAEVGIAWASVEEIDEMNILQASMLAMERAVARLDVLPDHVLVDGNRIPQGLSMPATPVVGGDGRCLSIAAASIIAKTWRDRIMVDLAQQHPGYGWETNAGYPSKAHKAALRDLGVTPHHRRSFRPVHNILYQGKL